MKVKNLLLIVSIFPLITSFAAPKFSTSEEIGNNTEYTLEGHSSVQDDLKDLSFVASDFAKYDNPTLITMNLTIHDELDLYFYIPNNSYDSVTDINLCDSTAQNSDKDYINNYTNKTVTLISFDKSDFVYKYVVDDYSYVTTEDNRFYVDSFNVDKDNATSLIGCGVEVLLNATDGEIVTNRVRVINVTDKVVAFDLLNLNGGAFHQNSYVAFNTNYSMEDLVKVRVSYKNELLKGITDIGYDIGWSDPHDTRFTSQFTGKGSFVDGGEVVSSDSVDKIIYHSDYEMTTYSDIFHKKIYKWDTVQKVSELDNASDSVKNYEWLLHFQISTFTATSKNDSFGNWHYNVDYGLAGAAQCDYNYFAYVHNFSILTFWYRENGVVKMAKAVDKPSNSTGQSDSTDPVVDNKWDKFLQWVMQNWPNSLYTIIAVLVGIVSIPVLITWLPALLKMVQLPFKLIKWLFSTRK